MSSGKSFELFYSYSIHIIINSDYKKTAENTISTKTGFVQTVKYCFPGLSRTCKDQILGFSRTHKTRSQRIFRINLVHKHGCIRSKKCTYQISYQCNCITVNKPKCNN